MQVKVSICAYKPSLTIIKNPSYLYISIVQDRKKDIRVAVYMRRLVAVAALKVYIGL